MPELSAAQKLIVTTLASLGPDGSAVSGHVLRIALLERGMDKRGIAVAIGELVAQGVLERLKVTDSDGLFYTAYRQASMIS